MGKISHFSKFFTLAPLALLPLFSPGCAAPDPGHTLEQPGFVIQSGEESPALEETAENVTRIFNRYKQLFRVRDQEVPLLSIFINGSGIRYDQDFFPALYMNSSQSIHFHSAPDNMLLMHEIAHHFMPAPQERIPVWLNEGIATYLGWSALDDERILVGEIPIIHYKTLKRLNRARRIMPLEEFLSLPPARFYEEERSLEHYSQAWGMIFYLFRCYLPRDLDFREKLNRVMAMNKDELVALEDSFLSFCREFSATQMMKERLVSGPDLRQLSSAYRLGLLQDEAALDSLLDLAVDDRKNMHLREVALHSSAMIAVAFRDYKMNRRLMRDLSRLKFHSSPRLHGSAARLYEALRQGDKKKVASLFTALSGGGTFYPAARIMVMESEPLVKN